MREQADKKNAAPLAIIEFLTRLILITLILKTARSLFFPRPFFGRWLRLAALFPAKSPNFFDELISDARQNRQDYRHAR